MTLHRLNCALPLNDAAMNRREVSPCVSAAVSRETSRAVFGDLRHNLTHFHCLTRVNLLNANDDLVIGRTGGTLQHSPKSLQ